MSSRRKPTPCPHVAPERVEAEAEANHSAAGSVVHAAVEATDAFLHATQLAHSHDHHHLGTGLRVGVGAIALARGGKALFGNKGIQAKLEGLASVGLGVASGASLFHTGAATCVSNIGQGVRGVAETALGAYQIWGHDHAGNHHEKSEIAKGVLNCAKGLTTFLPLLAHKTASSVGLLHLGIVGVNLALELSHPE